MDTEPRWGSVINPNRDASPEPFRVFRDLRGSFQRIPPFVGSLLVNYFLLPALDGSWCIPAFAWPGGLGILWFVTYLQNTSRQHRASRAAMDETPLMSQETLSHNDAPALEDGLGQQSFLDYIQQIILCCQPPKSIALTGYWGSGKTSALMRLYKRFKGRGPYEAANGQAPEGEMPSVIPVWFEAWRYQTEAQPIVALLHEIRDQMELPDKVRASASKLGNVALMGTLNIFDQVIKAASGGLFTPSLKEFQRLGESWEQQHYQQSLSTQQLHQFLEQAIVEVLNGESKARLVIFIDDLDRCTPGKALQLLEGIKVYLNLRNCVLVFGMDQRQIEWALHKALELSDMPDYSGPRQAREYLEKICQDIHPLPLPGQKIKTGYFIKLLQQLRVLDREQGTPAHLGRLERVLNQYDCLPANPRKIKTLVNRLGLLLENQEVKDSLGDGQDEVRTPGGESRSGISRRYALLLGMAIITCFHPRLYEQLQKNPAYIAKVVFYATHADPDSLRENPGYAPMRELQASFGNQEELPVNPSDGNVFRLHQLFFDLADIERDEIEIFLRC